LDLCVIEEADLKRYGFGTTREFRALIAEWGGQRCERRILKAMVKIIGAGLAGAEAAWQCARRGVAVELFEMRPMRSTPAHQTTDFAELVC